MLFSMLDRLRRNSLRAILLLLLTVSLLPVPAGAQTAGSARLTSLQTEAFPAIAAFLDVQDGEGRFVRGLTAEDVRVVEDGKSVPVTELQETRPGAQWVVAINPGPSMAVRNNDGLSRYELLAGHLQAWAQSRRGSTVDDLSLLVTNATEASHLADPETWMTTLISTTVDVKASVPTLDTLSRALDIAGDPLPRPGMRRAVLLITPPIEGKLDEAVDTLGERAVQENIAISVWMVSPAGAPLGKSGERLVGLAEKTGGGAFVFSGEEMPPDPEEYLEPLRSIYQISFQSQVKTSGAHEVLVELPASPGIATLPQSYEIEIQPPNPAFVSPSLEIVRRPLPDIIAGDELKPADFTPGEYNLQVLVDFPDGRMRPLARTALFVDGQLVAENTSPPFDRFTWDIRPYTSSASHLLRVEAEDTLGLKGSSIETMVQITVDVPKPNLVKSLSRHSPILAALAVLVTGSVLALVLVLGGRLQPHPRQKFRRKKNGSAPQPATPRVETGRRLTGWVNRLQWPQRRVVPQAYAFLAQVSEADIAAAATPIPLTADEITLGSDPNLATLVLNDPSVEGLHARLMRREDGSFQLCDEGSVAGTWVNYIPITQEWSCLEHGDLIHIGRIGFRFTLRQPARARKPVVIPVETIQ